MYEQLLCHLVGDYMLQSHAMAINKTISTKWAIYHGLLYTLPFVFIANPVALIIICVTHILIDRFAVARQLTSWKNYIFGCFDSQTLKEVYPESVPPFLSVWLVILFDNTMHLLINYFSINYL